MRRTTKIKKTISMKQFVTESGENFSKHMKQRLLELGTRCVLTRRENHYRLDLRHVEHIKYDWHNPVDDRDIKQKEYVYGQLVLNNGTLYFSEHCTENEDIMQTPVVRTIYNSLGNEQVLIDEDLMAKQVDDNNIDYIIDNLLEVCPTVSPEHMAIIARYC